MEEGIESAFLLITWITNNSATASLAILVAISYKNEFASSISPWDFSHQRLFFARDFIGGECVRSSTDWCSFISYWYHFLQCWIGEYDRLVLDKCTGPFKFINADRFVLPSAR